MNKKNVFKIFERSLFVFLFVFLFHVECIAEKNTITNTFIIHKQLRVVPDHEENSRSHKDKKQGSPDAEYLLKNTPDMKSANCIKKGTCAFERAYLVLEESDEKRARRLQDRYSIIPGVLGFGTSTRAAYGGLVPPKILHVNTLTSQNINSDETHGSFSWAIAQSFPRIIVFDVSGIIDIRAKDVQIRHPYVIIAGQTAPSPGIMFIGTGMRVMAHDILIQHIAIRVTEDVIGQPVDALLIVDSDDNGSCFSPYNIVIDHCSFSWATDENVDIWATNDSIHDVTLSNSIIAEGIKPHSCGSLIHADNVSIIGNLYAHNINRTPYLKGGSSSIVMNNIMYNIYNNFQLEDGNNYGLIKVAAEGNHHIFGNDTPENAPFLIVKPDVKSAEVYLHDNISIGEKVHDWNVDNIQDLSVRVDRPPVSYPGLMAYHSSQTKNNVLENAGTRPVERDKVDSRIVNDVLNHSGRIKEVRPLTPPYAENYNAFVPVAHPHVMADMHHTNLEKQLHRLSAALVSDSLVKPKVESGVIKILLVGDSTVTDDHGWGGALSGYLNDQVKIINKAVGGTSSRSYIEEGLWADALTERPDFIFIQFGHNDSKQTNDRYTDPKTTYKEYIVRYIDDSRAAGAIPILVTPMVVTDFDGLRLVPTVIDTYADSMKEVGANMSVDTVDLNTKSKMKFESIGSEATWALQPKGDITHWNSEGSAIISKLIVDELVSINSEISKRLHLKR